MTSGKAQTYQFQLAGHLDESWTASFDNVTITHCDDGTTALTGQVVDQAQLHGILARIRDLGAVLIAVQMLAGPTRSGPAGCTRAVGPNR